MAVLGRLLISSAERLDLPDLLSIDSYTAGDFKYLVETFVGANTPYIIAGFDVINPAAAIGTTSCAITIANSAMYYPGAGAGSFYYGLPVGDPNAQPLVPVLVTNATNYVYLTLTTENTAPDTRAFWDPDANGQVGDEFTEEVNTESVIQVQANVSTSAFPENTVPVAIIIVGATSISSITDARPLMFRLGTGGQSPNPFNTFPWPALPTSSYERTEPPITITSGSGPNPFEGADKNILTLKQWMDAVMSRIAELSGSPFWYADVVGPGGGGGGLTSLSLYSVFHDALETAFKSKGLYNYSSATAGLLTWTEDIWIISVSDPRFYMLRAGNITIPNEEVAYIPLVRGQPLNSLNQAVAWTNGQAYVNTPNGSIGFFANVLQGDWIKKLADDPTYYLRVEQFYAGTNASGAVTTPANAKSVLLSSTYLGATTNDIGIRDQGVYQSTDIVIDARNNIAISQAGGNFFWFALRSDVIENIASISTVTLSGIITSATGVEATVTSIAHGLVNGDRITVTAPGAQAGTYSVDVVDVNTFTFNTTNTTTGAFTAFYGLMTTAATTNGYGLQIQSADHGCDSGDTVNVTLTTNYNGAYVVNVRSATQLQFAIGAAYATETSGNEALSILDVRTEQGITRIVQGQTIEIGTDVAENIQSYIGMPSLATPLPTYVLPPGYNTFDNESNYNSGVNDNLTLRAAQLTGMMADKAQDKTVKYLTEATTANNTTSGSAQQITFTPSSSSLTLLQPSSPGNCVIALPSVAPGISLLVNQSAYVFVNRNAATTPTINVANTSAVPLDENVFVIASRLNDANVYLWDGTQVTSSTPLVNGGAALVKVKYFDPLSQTLPTGNPVVEDGNNVQAGDLVLFSNLSAGSTLEYSQTANNQDLGPFSSTPYVGLSLASLPSSFSLSSVVFSLLNNGGLASGNAVVAVYSDTAGAPGSLLGTSNTVAISSMPTSVAGNVTFTFGSSIPLTSGSRYYFIVQTSSLVNGTDLTIWGVNPSAGGNTIEYSTDNGVTWHNSAGGSVYAELFGVGASAGNNQVYMANGTGTNITGWTLQYPFGGSATPSSADTVIVEEGNSFQDQIGKFNDTTWVFNDKVRYFGITNGASATYNYFEQDALVSTTLADNTVNGTAFSVNYTGSEYQIIDFSLNRGTGRETGTLWVTSDGTTVSVSSGSTYINTCGVTFSAAIVAGVFYLYYTTTSTGVAANMKFMVRRWSNASGGPSGVPSYTASSSTTSAAGPAESIQYNNGGLLGGSSNFLIDATNGYIILNGLYHSILSNALTIVDNEVSPGTLFSYNATTFPFAVIEYSIVRNGDYRTGRILIANDGSTSAMSDDNVATNDVGVTFIVTVSAGNVNVQYASTSTGFNGVFKYSIRQWS